MPHRMTSRIALAKSLFLAVVLSLITGTCPLGETCLFASSERLPAHPETGSILAPEQFRQAAAWSAYARGKLALGETQNTALFKQTLTQTLRLDPVGSKFLRDLWLWFHRDSTHAARDFEPIYRAHPDHVDNLILFAGLLHHEKQRRRAYELLCQALIRSHFRQGRLLLNCLHYASPAVEAEVETLLQLTETLPPETIRDRDAVLATRANFLVRQLGRVHKSAEKPEQKSAQVKALHAKISACLATVDTGKIDAVSCLYVCEAFLACHQWQELHNFLIAIKDRPECRTSWWLELLIETSKQRQDAKTLFDVLNHYDLSLIWPNVAPKTKAQFIDLCFEYGSDNHRQLAIELQLETVEQNNTPHENLRLAQLFMATGQHDSVQAILEHLAQKQLTVPQRLFKNDLLIRIGQKEAAYKDFGLMLAEHTFGSKPQKKLPLHFYYRYSTLCWQLGKREQACELAAICHQLEPESHSICNYYGYLLAEMNQKLSLAQQLILKALKAEPDNIAYLDSLAWVHFRRQEYKQALQVMTKLLKLCNFTIPDFDEDEEIAGHLQQIFQKLGLDQTARLYAPKGGQRQPTP